MVELLQTDNPGLILMIKAALEDADIPVFEFDGPVADLYGALFPRRLMVHEDDLGRARRIVRDMSPEVLS